MTMLMLLSITISNAQISNEKTEKVKIFGNCGMCKKTIEKAGNITDIAIVKWDKKTSMATITYDALKTNQEEILTRIALAGYDSEKIKAKKEDYDKLPGCCQYEREN